MKNALVALLAATVATTAGCNTTPSSSTTGGTSAGATGAVSTGSGSTGSGSSSATTSSNGGTTGLASSTGGTGQVASSGGASGAGASSGSGTGGGTAAATTGGGTGGGATSGGNNGTPGGNSGSSSDNTVALVDNDGYVNDSSSPSDDAALPVYKTLMKDYGFQAYDTISIDSDGSQSWNVSSTVVALPTPTQLAQYTTLVWFTADNGQYGAGTDEPLSADQEANLTAWLDLGDKNLVIVSEALIGQEVGAAGGWTAGGFTDPLFTTYLPLLGATADPYNCATASDCVPLASAAFGVSGGSIVSMTFGTSAYNVSVATALPTSGITAAALNPPASGVDTVASVDASPQSTGLANSELAVTVGARHIGAQGTSAVAYVAFPIEAIQTEPVGSGLGDADEFFGGVLTYAGVVP